MPSRRLVEAYTARLSTIRQRTAALVVARYTAAEDTERFVLSAVAPTLAGQRAAVVLTAAYAARSTGRRFDIDPDEHIGATLRGVSIEAQYGRAVNQADDPEMARRLVEVTAFTGVQLAMRSAFSASVPEGTRYRRVLTGNSCPRCTAAADKTYGKADLLPIHAHCDCGVAVVASGSDPAAEINAPTITAVSKEHDGLPDVIERHDAELGPVLELAGRSPLTTVRVPN